MGKALFFDIDGTLVNFQGKMPDSAKQALMQVKKNGHQIVICSGRSVCQIYPWLLDLGFDGLIAAAGADLSGYLCGTPSPGSIPASY